jgi:hypothetical protein
MGGENKNLNAQAQRTRRVLKRERVAGIINGKNSAEGFVALGCAVALEHDRMNGNWEAKCSN